MIGAIFQSSAGFELLLEVVKAASGVFIATVTGIVGYYAKGEYREHRKNTAVRRYLVGDPQLEEVEDKGQIDEFDTRFDEIRDDMEEQHEAVHDELKGVRRLTERIAAQLEAHDGFDFTRGGKRRADGGTPKDD